MMDIRLEAMVKDRAQMVRNMTDALTTADNFGNVGHLKNCYTILLGSVQDLGRLVLFIMQDEAKK